MRLIDFSQIPALFLLFIFLFPQFSSAAPPDRIARAVNRSQIRTLSGHVHRLAQPQFNRGPVDAAMNLDQVVILFKPSAAQQADLDSLLADQQNPSSPSFHKWLTPEEFGNRFGLSPSDESKVAAWLASEGLSVKQTARGRNWIAFHGTAGQIGKSLHTTIARFEVDGETHFANATEPAVPEALADVVAGFAGLNDFHLKPMAHLVPDYNTSTSHYLVPEDYATVYNIAPLYQAGLDGTGQSIAVVGQSDVLLSDLRAFRTRYNLPANDPKMVPYAGDPGYNGAQLEGNLDLEWASAIAPKATIYYVYGPNAIVAIITAVNLNMAQVITISYGACEIDYAASYYRSIAQQGNAQGITLFAASGDSGAAGCDSQGVQPFANRGRSVDFPAVMPEVTGVGGTQFVEGTGTYWAATNTANFGSALSYIPEAAWNESGTPGLLSSGGGASLIYPKPAWQAAPGVPDDNVRHVPDVSLSAAGHDAYYVSYLGGNAAVSGTSASAPSMAGIAALLNQYQVSKGFQSQPGLGNINPQLYRLAQSVPAAFHDITAGTNVVPCLQGSPDCATGSFGYETGPGYDMATGLGSIDANVLVTQWNTAARGVTVKLTSSVARPGLNDTVTLTATVAAASGSGTPTGTVSFSTGVTPLGSAPLSASGSQTTAAVTIPVYRLGFGASVAATYSGDSAFSSGGATLRVPVILPAGSAILVSGPNTVWPQPADAQGLSWETSLSLFEQGGAPSVLTGFTIDGKDQPLAQYFPSTAIPAFSTLNTTLVLRNLAAPLTRTYGFTGIDSFGQTWSRQVAVNYAALPPYTYFHVSALPLVVAQSTAAKSSCEWPVQLSIDDLGGGALNVISNVTVGGVSLTRAQIVSTFGADRLDAYGSLQGTVCLSAITPPASENIYVALANGTSQEITVSFVGPATSLSTLSATPATINLTAASAAQPGQAVLNAGITDKTQFWTASIFPAGRTTAWLSLSQLSGTGPAQITLTANGTGFEPGIYRANIVIQSPNAAPQTISVPVSFLLGASSSGTLITGVGSPATYQGTGSPGMLFSVFGTKLANSTAIASGSPISYSLAGVSATVNGLPAPVLYASPTQINIQIPYAAGAGPAVLGINNNGQIAGTTFQIAASAPGIFTDANGNVFPKASITQGSPGTLYITGAGEISPALKTAYAPSSGNYTPVLPVSMTIGGSQVFLAFVGSSPGAIGVTQINFTVPGSVPTGNQPVVVTVGGISSPPANIVVQPQ